MEYPEGELIWESKDVGVIVVLEGDKYHVYTSYLFSTGKLVWFHLNVFNHIENAIDYAKLVKRH